MLALPVAVLVAVGAAAQPATPRCPEFRDDPRFELLAVVQMLAGGEKSEDGFYLHDLPYVRAAESRFRPFAAHPVVARYKDLRRSGADYLAFYDLLFRVGPPPALAPSAPPPDGTFPLLGDPERSEEFRALLADFASTTAFDAFFTQTSGARAALAGDIAEQARALSVVPALEGYLGQPVAVRCTVILSPFAEPVLVMTVRTLDDDGTPRLTTVYGPDVRRQTVLYRFATRLGGLWTDLASEALRPAAARHAERVARGSAAFEALRGTCAPTWADCVHRHIAYAVGARLLALRGGAAGREMAARWPEKYLNYGLPYLGAVIDRLREYEKTSPRPPLADFYPRLVDAVDEAAARGRPLPFRGTIADLLARRGPVVVVVPQDPPPALAAAIDALVAARWPRAPRLVAPKDEDLAGADIVAIGTPRQNPWLARRFPSLGLPAHLDAGAVRFDPRQAETSSLVFEGAGLVTAARSPLAAEHGVLLFTAPDPDADRVPGLLSYSGPGDYAVLKDGSVLRSGVYEKSWLPWRLK